MTAFKQYLAIEANKRTSLEMAEVVDQLSNWSYLHLSFMEEEPTRAELEVMMYAEMENRNRAQILYRLYSRWQRAIRKEHHKEMGI
jgi:hypothetical protein